MGACPLGHRALAPNSSRLPLRLAVALGSFITYFFKMDEIQELVRKIVRQCASRGVTVSEVLAAFVARTVSEGKRG